MKRPRLKYLAEKPAPIDKDMTRLMSGTREEMDLELEVVEGTLPEDLHGHVYINSAVGSVNSGGLPYPEFKEDGEPNREFGSPIFNGDGFMIRLSFDQPGKVALCTRLMKTPSYWADLALREGGAASRRRRYKGRDWKFSNIGLGRFSFQLGQTNPLNVGVQPVKFKENEPTRLIATYDAGRPWEIDPATMAVKAPILKNDDTLAVSPEWMRRYPFKGILSSAHPVYDALTRELFIVNYIKSVGSLVGFQRMMLSSFRNPEKTRAKVMDAIEKARATGGEEGLKEFQRFVEEGTEGMERRKVPRFRDAFANVQDKVMPGDSVFLLRWTGSPDIKRWRVRCEGKDISIKDNMHQMGITENYLILQDSSFKMNLSLMFNLLRPQYPELDEMLRDLLTQPMNPFSTLYFVKRSDLTDDRQSVDAVKAIIPLECVHFAANYKEENGLITVMTANNTASCPAEWVRHFDKLKSTGEPMDKKWLGYLNAGPMDVGRIGRYVFDPTTGSNVAEKTSVLFEKGNLNQSEEVGQHTWAVGLYSFRGYEEVTPRPEKLNSIYWQVFGLDREVHTEFIFELYKDYPHREVSIEEMERLSGKGVPMGLARIDHEDPTLAIKDFFMFGQGYYMRSVQFIPRKTRNEALPEDQDGYLMCTINVPQDEACTTYRSEVWLWDAANLAKGPVCKLHHPQFKFAFTLHSVWTETAAPTNPETQIDVIDDIDDQILAIGNFVRQVRLEDFMEDYVYPHFADQPNAVDDWDPADYTGRAYKWILRTLGLRKRFPRLTQRDI